MTTLTSAEKRPTRAIRRALTKCALDGMVRVSNPQGQVTAWAGLMQALPVYEGENERC